ncbi:MAG: response regulator, partial [Coraliomargarita sp.]
LIDSAAYRSFIVTPSDCFYRMCHSILSYGGLDLERVENAAEAVERLGDERGVLLVDRSLWPAFTPSLDQDIIEPLPDSLHRLLISEVVPPDSVESAEVITYPISRYKLLSTIFDLFEIRLPGFLFQRYEEGAFDEVDLSGLRVLVAEDNKINQKVARMTIERFGATVDLAANGQEVLELVGRFEYDLILMDIRMPVMDGVESCLALRAKGIDIPVYALTADAMKGDRERFLHAGMSGYLSKPLAEGDLVDVLLKNRSRPPCAESDAPDAPDASDASDAADVFYLEAAKADVLNLSAFYAVLSGNQEIALELLEEFTSHAQEHFDEAESAFNSGSWDDARSCFHKLAGSAATVCAYQVRAYCLGMERSLMEDPPDIETCGHYLSEGRGALRNLCEKINQLLKDR